MSIPSGSVAQDTGPDRSRIPGLQVVPNESRRWPNGVDIAKEGLAAAPDHYLEDLEAAYDRAALEDPRWLETTLCGRRWILMASGEDSEDEQAVFAPTCRRCLALMDKLFPQPALDSRFPLTVQIVTDTVIEHGTAEIFGVPGDH